VDTAGAGAQQGEVGAPQQETKRGLAGKKIFLFKEIFINGTPCIGLKCKIFLLFIEPKYSGDRSNELLELFDAALAINDSDQFLTNVLCELLSASLAKSSWDKYCSGWCAWLDFELTQDNCVKWPVNIQTFRKFAAWCIAHRNISHRTAMSYLYSVSIAHSLKGMSCVNYHDDKILKLMMSGAKHAYGNHSVICSNRRVANTYTLKLISHELATSNWCDISKQTVWACCLFRVSKVRRDSKRFLGKI
jgi:hypothetical protein